MLGLSGAQLFAVSILGDYLGKVLEEAKGRPRFIRSKIFRGIEAIQSEEEIAQVVAARREMASARSRDQHR